MRISVGVVAAGVDSKTFSVSSVGVGAGVTTHVGAGIGTPLFLFLGLV